MTYLINFLLDKDRRQNQIKSFLEGVKEELQVLWNLYNGELGVHWEKFKKDKEKIFWFKTSLTQDYFTIYHSNTNLIGQIQNPELRRKIVELYTLLKLLIDFYKMNNTLMDEYNEADPLARVVFENDPNVQGFTERLKGHHCHFVRLRKEVSRMIEKELAKYSRPW